MSTLPSVWSALSRHLHMTDSYLPFTTQLTQLLLSNLSWFPPSWVNAPLFSGTEVPRLGFSCSSLASCAFTMPVLRTDCQLLKARAHFCSSSYSQYLAHNATRQWMNDWKINLTCCIINKQDICWKHRVPTLPIRSLVNLGGVNLSPWIISLLDIETNMRNQIYKTRD